MLVRKNLQRSLWTRITHQRIATVAVCAIATLSAAAVSDAATISNSGLLAEYAYEASGGVAVTAGQSAAGAQVDDTGFNPAGPNHATGSPFVPGSLSSVLSYSTDVAGGVGSGRALSFGLPESNSNYVSVPITQGSALDNIGQGDFYFEAWFKTTDTDRGNLFATHGTGTSFNVEVGSSNRLRVYLNDGSGTDDIYASAPGITYSDDQWHQIKVVRDNSLLTLSLDGVIAGSPITSNRAFEQTATEFRIGQDNRGSSTPKFTGLIDNIRLHSGTSFLSPSVVRFDFDAAGGVATTHGQSAAGTVDDTSANVNHGTGFSAALVGIAPAEPEYRADVPSVLAGSSTYSFEAQETGTAGVESASFTVTPEVAAMTQGDFTIETWFKTTDTGRGAMIGTCCTTANSRIGLELHTDNKVRLWVNGPTATSDANYAAPGGIDTRDGEWHHALGKRDGNTVSVWVDGVLAGSKADTAGDFNLSTVEDMFLTRDARIGATQFDGLLDNTRIWTRALSQSEIEALAAGAVPVPEPSSMVLVMIALGGLAAGRRRRRAS